MCGVNRHSQIENLSTEKTSRPQLREFPVLRAAFVGKLGFFLFLGGVLGLRGLRLGEALLELVHATGGVHELLLARVKRVADVADADDDGRAGRARRSEEHTSELQS